MNPVNPKKLLLSKWTAVKPLRREKHFLVTKVIQEEEGAPIVFVEIEAIYSNTTYQIPWRALANAEEWRIGWV